MKPEVDYTLYLVTDSELLAPGNTVQNMVKSAIEGGVTVVQLREKRLDTGAFIALAHEVKAICKTAGVPLVRIFHIMVHINRLSCLGVPWS